jgi:hypothetical protein
MEKHLEKFRRALPRQDQGLFDELFGRARQRQQAAVQAANAGQMESIFIAVLIDLLREQKRLQARLDKLEKELQEA